MSWRSKAKYYVRKVSPTGRIIFYVYDKFGNVVYEKAEDAANDQFIDPLLEAAGTLLDELEGLGAELIDDIQDVSLEVANAILDIIQGAGLAAIEGVELAFDYTYSRISPHRVEAVSVATSMVVYLTTAVIMFKQIKGAN